jgi:predicted amino acid racemase
MEKPTIPMGEMGTNVEGQAYEFDEKRRGETSYRAIVDLGLLDVDEVHIAPVDEAIKIVGASSDMLVIDIGNTSGQYKVGSEIEFKMDYMGVLRIMNSKYVGKRIVR